MANRISIIVSSGSIEKLQMAAMVASVGAVSGNEVTVFVSMNALPVFRKGATAEAPSEGPVGRLLVEKKAPGYKQLFQQAIELGDAKIHPCSMAMDILGYRQQDIEDYVGAPMGLTKFLDHSAAGQVWTF
ncbi:MAG: DsrE/DsrF/DrsH-like family protein [Burkholderiales bacterium]|nr:DsrE/DsrF/DrsH-like family protein [Burkholderiales bacterium]